MLFSSRTSEVIPTLRRFWRREDASTTIEFVLWLPVMLTLLLVAAQGSLLMITQGGYGRVAYEAARSVSRHAFSVSEAEDWIAARWADAPSVPMAQVTVDTDSGMVTVSIAQEVSNLMIFNPLGLADGYRISAQVVHMMEPS